MEMAEVIAEAKDIKKVDFFSAQLNRGSNGFDNIEESADELDSDDDNEES